MLFAHEKDCYCTNVYQFTKEGMLAPDHQITLPDTEKIALNNQTRLAKTIPFVILL